jgi:hypothetical protein
MQACQWQNIQAGRQIDVLGVVSNGQGWVFYKLDINGQVFESATYSLGDLPLLWGGITLCIPKMRAKFTPMIKSQRGGNCRRNRRSK